MSVEQTHEEGRAASVVALAAGSVPASSAEALASNWEDRAKGLQINAVAASSPELKARLICASDVFWLCARQLRRQMDFSDDRQPAPNIEGEPRAKRVGSDASFGPNH